MWSLSDEKLVKFFQFSKRKTTITDHMNPVSVPNITVGALAGAIYYTSKNGLRAQARQILDPFKESPLTKEVARRLGFQNRIVSAIGIMSVPALFISLSATSISSYFGAEPTLWLSAAIWPVIALSLHSGYKIVLELLAKQTEKNEGNNDII